MTTVAKRPAASTSDSPLKVSAEKRRAGECANCGCTKGTAIRTVCTSAGTSEVALCKACIPMSPRDKPLFVLSELDEDTGLPLLACKNEMTADSVLGNFADRRSLPNCSLCHCTVGLRTCHPLRWKENRQCTRDTKIDLVLCIHCRHCLSCGELVDDGEGIDHEPRRAATQQCTQCALWCSDCSEAVDSSHFQKAWDVECIDLCYTMCCGCQQEKADVRHPHSDRGYCSDCVLKRNYWRGDSDPDEGEPNDADRWDELIEKVNELD